MWLAILAARDRMNATAPPSSQGEVAPPRRGHLFVLAFGVTLLAVYGCFVPLEFHDMTWDAAVEKFRQVRAVDFGQVTPIDWIVHILLFAPMAFLWTSLVDIDQRQRWPGVVWAVPVVALLGGLAVAIEFGQIWTVRRSVSLNDIYADLIGIGVGIGLWFVAGRWSVARVRDIWRTDADAPPIKRLLQLYAVAFFLYCVQPLDVALSPEALRLKAEQGRILLRPFGHTYGSAADLLWQVFGDVVLFIPIGMMLRLKGRGRRTVIAATLFGVALAIAIEAAQFLVFSRYTDVTDVFTSGIGALLGAVLVGWLPWTVTGKGRQRSRLPGRWRAAIAVGLILLYTLPLLAAFWHPYTRVASTQVFQENLRGFLAAPFQAYYVGGEFIALTNIVRSVILFAPIGAVVRWATGPRSVAVAGLACAAAALPIGLAIEVGQAGLVDKIADVTDLGLYLFGAVGGYFVAQVILREPGEPGEPGEK